MMSYDEISMMLGRITQLSESNEKKLNKILADGLPQCVVHAREIAELKETAHAPRKSISIGNGLFKIHASGFEARDLILMIFAGLLIWNLWSQHQLQSCVQGETSKAIAAAEGGKQ